MIFTFHRHNGVEIASVFDQNHKDNHKNSMAGKMIFVYPFNLFCYKGKFNLRADKISLVFTNQFELIFADCSRLVCRFELYWRLKTSASNYQKREKSHDGKFIDCISR